MYTTEFYVYAFQNWNYFSDSEGECVKMMEEIEKLCDRLELTRYDHHLTVDLYQEAAFSSFGFKIITIILSILIY